MALGLARNTLDAVDVVAAGGEPLPVIHVSVAAKLFVWMSAPGLMVQRRVGVKNNGPYCPALIRRIVPVVLCPCSSGMSATRPPASWTISAPTT